MSKSVFIISAGGHAKVLLECLIAMGKNISAFIETDATKIGCKILNIDVISQDFFLKNYAAADVLLVNGLGSINVPLLRKKVFLFFKEREYSFLNLIHPTAYVAKDIVLGEGSQVLAGSILQIGSAIQDNVIVNTGALIDHDCIIGHHSHIAPGATLSGGVSIDESCHIGCAATVVQGITIEKESLVAAGAVVIADLEKNSRVAGVPAKKRSSDDN